MFISSLWDVKEHTHYSRSVGDEVPGVMAVLFEYMAYVPTLPDYPGVSRIRNDSPGLPYGSLNLPDKNDSEPFTDVSPF